MDSMHSIPRIPAPVAPRGIFRLVRYIEAGHLLPFPWRFSIKQAIRPALGRPLVDPGRLQCITRPGKIKKPSDLHRECSRDRIYEFIGRERLDEIIHRP